MSQKHFLNDGERQRWIELESENRLKASERQLTQLQMINTRGMVTNAQMLKILIPSMCVSLLIGCTYCYDNVQTEAMCDAEPCPVQPSGDTGDTGGEEAVCSPYYTPEYGTGNTRHMSCGGYVSNGEHMYVAKASEYGVTDYVPGEVDATWAVLYDFVPLGSDPWSLNNPNNALPGVVVYEQLGIQFSAHMSRGCCAQHTVGEPGVFLDWIPNPECNSGAGLRDTPDGWCLPMDIDAHNAGGCVYPCADADDCPAPAMEFCDLTRPDPAGRAPGVCRYKSMPDVPTELANINNPSMPLISEPPSGFWSYLVAETSP